MKARVPYYYSDTTEACRRRAVTAQMLLFMRALNQTCGWGRDRLLDFYAAVERVIEDVAEWRFGNAGNKTWVDELDYWAEKQDLKIPPFKKYRLYFFDLGDVGRKQRHLLLLDLYALKLLKLGPVRLQRVLTAYDELSGMNASGCARYTFAELQQWANEHKIYFPGCAEDRARLEVKPGETEAR